MRASALRIEKRERIRRNISGDEEYERDDQKCPDVIRFEYFELNRTTEKCDEKHYDEKIRENQSVKGNHRVKTERGQNFAVKQSVKSARQTAAWTGETR